MRYFLFSFNIEHRKSIGSIAFASEKFPSLFEIENYVCEAAKQKLTIVLMGIFEFKTEEDYNSYRTIPNVIPED